MRIGADLHENQLFIEKLIFKGILAMAMAMAMIRPKYAYINWLVLGDALSLLCRIGRCSPSDVQDHDQGLMPVQ